MSDEADIFDMNPSAPSAPVSSAAASEPLASQRRARASKPWFQRIKLAHLMIGIALIGAVIIFWPSSNGRPASHAQPRFTPAAAMAAAAHAADQDEPAIAASSTAVDTVIAIASEPASHTADTPTTTVAVATSAAASLPRVAAVIPGERSAAPAAPASVATAAAPSELPAAAAEQLATIEKDLGRLSAQIKRLEDSQQAKRYEPRHGARNDDTKRTIPDVIVRAPNGERYAVNTVGRGLAWLQAGGHVELVQPGDRIGAVRVLAVDPVRRVVITSEGVIR